MRNTRVTNTENQSLKDKLMAIILLETAKDFKEMDSDLVTECVDFLMEIEEKQNLSNEEIKQRVNNIPFKGKVTAINSFAKKKIRAKRLAVVAAVLAVILALFGIVAVASGNSFGELFKQMGTAIYELLDGKPMQCDNITLIKPNETKEYASIEELIKDEEIDILYPTWLPENEKIVKIWCLNEDGVVSYTLQCESPQHSIDVDVNVGENLFDKILMSNCIKKEISKYTIYYEKNEEYIQASFVHNKNIYFIKSDTEDNLFMIIENLKEIN